MMIFIVPNTPSKNITDMSNSNTEKEATTRISISLSPTLAKRFDDLIRKTGKENRSLEIADMIRQRLIDDEVESGKEEVMGTITLLYDHHKFHVSENLTEIQHVYHHQIVSTLHVHMDYDNCLEVIVVKGKGNEIKKLSERLKGLKGIKNGKLTMTSMGKKVPG